MNEGRLGGRSQPYRHIQTSSPVLRNGQFRSPPKPSKTQKVRVEAEQIELMSQLVRKMRKVFKLAPVPAFRRGLRMGVAASIEHAHILRRHPFKTMIDIGANRGQFSLLAKGTLPGVDIQAFEPLSGPRETYKRLFWGDDSVHIYPFAAGAEEGVSHVNILASDDRSSLMPSAQLEDVFAGAGNAKVGEEETRVARVDDVLRDVPMQGPVFCKIDVQGFELEAIKGCEGLLDQIDFFYVECCTVPLYDGQPAPLEVMNHLDQRGYDWVRIGYLSGGGNESGVVADMLFVKRS